MQRKRAAVWLLIGVLALAAFAVWRQGRSVADLAEVRREGMELRDVQIWKYGSAAESIDDVRFYRQDAELAEALAEFLAGIECRYHHSSDTISYGHLIYDEDGNVVEREYQALYDLWIYGAEGDRLQISVLDDGRVYADGKCYYLKKEFAADCITERLEEILREYPEDAGE